VYENACEWPIVKAPTRAAVLVLVVLSTKILHLYKYFCPHFTLRKVMLSKRYILVASFVASFCSCPHGFQLHGRRCCSSRVAPSSISNGNVHKQPWSPRASSPNDDPSTDQERSERGTTKSINSLLNELGLSFKARAEENIRKSKESQLKSKRFGCALVSTFYFVLFLFYRAYRGFFVLLPEIFRRVYDKLESTVGVDLSLEDKKVAGVRSVTWQTKLTVFILATVVTCSYFIGGVFRIASKFCSSIGRTSSVPESFGAAAREAVDHENRIRKKMLILDDNQAGESADGLSP
jgi:hypothetical protein